MGGEGGPTLNGKCSKKCPYFFGNPSLSWKFLLQKFCCSETKGEASFRVVIIHCERRSHTIPPDINCQLSRCPHLLWKKTKEVVGNVTPSPFLLRNPKLFIRRSWWSHIVSAFRQTILESVLVSWKMQKKPPGNLPIIGPFYQETKRGPNLSWPIRNFDTSTDGNLLDLMILWFHFIKPIALSVSQPLRHSLTGLGEFCSRFWSQIHAISFLVLFIISLSQGQKLFHLLRSWSSLWMSVLVHWTSIDSLKNNVQLSKLSTLSKSFYMDLSAPSALTVSKCGYFDLF